MILPQSLRWRMQFWYGLLLAGALAGFGVMAHRQQKSSDLKRIDLALEGELMVMLAELRGELRPPRRLAPGRMPPPPRRERLLRDFISSGSAGALLDQNRLDDDYLVIWGRDGTELGRLGAVEGGVPFPSTSRGEDAYNLPRTRGAFREVYRFRAPGDCLLLGRSIEAEQQEWDRLAWRLAASGLGILALGLLGGWLFLSRSLRPIDAISRSARKFAGGQLQARIPEENVGGELAQLTRDLNETFDELEQSFARQSRFTADAAHELRTPVAVILSHAQGALLKEREVGAYQEALRSCERGAKRLQSLIDSLLALSRLDAGTDAAPPIEVDLASLARECLEFMRPLADARQLAVNSELEPVSCLGRPDQLRQVVVNLLANAINFSGSGGAIAVSVSREDGQASLSVEDRGRGIAEEHLPHLFERFYRADASRGREAGGAGLGLAICDGIIRDHGGTVEVESTIGVGTTFTVRMPIHEAPIEQARVEK